MEGENILEDELRGIPASAVIMSFNIEPDAIPPFGEEPLRPPAEPAEEINAKRLFHGKDISFPPHSPHIPTSPILTTRNSLLDDVGEYLEFLPLRQVYRQAR